MSDSFTVLLPLIASIDAVSSHFLLPVRLPNFGLDPNKEILSCDQKIVSAIHPKLKIYNILYPYENIWNYLNKTMELYDVETVSAITKMLTAQI
jgi:hypothetical protein